VVYPGRDGVLPGLEAWGVSVGEFGESVAGGIGERGQLAGDLDLAVAVGAVDGGGHGAGSVAGRHAGIRDALAGLPAGHEPDGVLAVGVGWEHDAWLGVVGGRGRESGPGIGDAIRAPSLARRAG